MYKFLIKRCIDIVAASILLVLLSPFLLCISIVLWYVNGGTPFFYQQRPGLNGRIFLLWKFKTMTDAKGKDGQLLPDNERLTKIGSFIRNISFDEIPQLFNVLYGNMSLIGPRPLLVKYLPLYSSFQMRRHEVKPGITGWAQVNGRNAIGWQEKFNFDVWYVDNLTFILDMRILFLTILKVLRRDGINSSEVVTMHEFNGDN